MKKFSKYIIMLFVFFVMVSQIYAAPTKVGQILMKNRKTKQIFVAVNSNFDSSTESVVLKVNGKLAYLAVSSVKDNIAVCYAWKKYRRYFAKIYPGYNVYEYYEGIWNSASEISTGDYMGGNLSFNVTTSKKIKIYMFNYSQWKYYISRKSVKSQNYLQNLLERKENGDTITYGENMLLTYSYAGYTTSAKRTYLKEGSYYIGFVSSEGVFVDKIYVSQDKTKKYYNLDGRKIVLYSNVTNFKVKYEYLDSGSEGELSSGYSKNLTISVPPFQKGTILIEPFHVDCFSRRSIKLDLDNIKQNSSYRINVNFKKKVYGKVRISSEEYGSEVYLDGKYMGTTPITFKIPVWKKSKIEVKKSGYHSKSIVVRGDKNDMQNYELTPRKYTIDVWPKFEWYFGGIYLYDSVSTLVADDIYSGLTYGGETMMLFGKYVPFYIKGAYLMNKSNNDVSYSGIDYTYGDYKLYNGSIGFGLSFKIAYFRFLGLGGFNYIYMDDTYVNDSTQQKFNNKYHMYGWEVRGGIEIIMFNHLSLFGACNYSQNYNKLFKMPNLIIEENNLTLLTFSAGLSICF